MLKKLKINYIDENFDVEGPKKLQGYWNSELNMLAADFGQRDKTAKSSDSSTGSTIFQPMHCPVFVISAKNLRNNKEFVDFVKSM